MVPMAFLSGAFYPMSLMPGWLQAVSWALPLRYFNDGVADALSGRATLAQTGLDCAALAGFALVLRADRAALVPVEQPPVSAPGHTLVAAPAPAEELAAAAGRPGGGPARRGDAALGAPADPDRRRRDRAPGRGRGAGRPVGRRAGRPVWTVPGDALAAAAQPVGAGGAGDRHGPARPGRLAGAAGLRAWTRSGRCTSACRPAAGAGGRRPATGGAAALRRVTRLTWRTLAVRTVPLLAEPLCPDCAGAGGRTQPAGLALAGPAQAGARTPTGCASAGVVPAADRRPGQPGVRRPRRRHLAGRHARRPPRRSPAASSCAATPG